MARLIVEDERLLDMDRLDVEERWPQVMQRLGYRKDGDEWVRGNPSAGYWSLPDRCPTHLCIHCEEAGEGSVRCRLRYSVRLPGQIMANTDAKALELEADRLWALLQGEEEPDFSQTRGRLVKLTLMANLALAGLPGVAFIAVTLLLMMNFPPNVSTARLMVMVLGGVLAWLIALLITAQLVVRTLNRAVKTRLRWRSG